MSDAAGRALFLDGLRGVAALGVTAGHVFGPASLLTHGRMGVLLFFAISGYAISASLSGRNVTPARAGRFFVRRMVRLDPPYWASMVLAMALAASHRLPWWPGWSSIGLHLTYSVALAGRRALEDVYWTLYLEVQFYAVLVVLLAAERRIPWRWLFTPLLVASVLAWRHVLPAPAGLFLPWWWAFAAGVAAYRIARDGDGAMVIVCAFACLATGSEEGLSSALSLVLVVVAIRAGAMARWLSGPRWQWLGAISYSLYLTHPLTGWRLVGVLDRHGVPHLAAAVVSVAFAVGCAAVFWAVVERPALRWSRKLRVT